MVCNEYNDDNDDVDDDDGYGDDDDDVDGDDCDYAIRPIEVFLCLNRTFQQISRFATILVGIT